MRRVKAVVTVEIGVAVEEAEFRRIAAQRGWALGPELTLNFPPPRPPAFADPLPGTRTWTETKARRPARRVRKAWNLMVSPAWPSSTLVTARNSSSGRALSIRPAIDPFISDTPVRTIFAATSRAMIGSSRSKPVR